MGTSVSSSGLVALLFKIEGLDPEDFQGPFPHCTIGQRKGEICSLLQRALPSIPSMPLLVSTLPPSCFLDLSQVCPDSCRTRDTVAGNFYIHSPSPFLPFPSFFFTPRISSFIIPTFKAAIYGRKSNEMFEPNEPTHGQKVSKYLIPT